MENIWTNPRNTWLAFKPGRTIRVLRIPRHQIALWYADVVKRAKNGCMEEYIEEISTMNEERLRTVLGMYDKHVRDSALVIRPILESVPAHWPPDSGITSWNTLEFEDAVYPFYVDIADN
ncbi:hypothetical protein NMY22_g18480 [Coprinellus aureogranulatus]|nr:hypothetical protein NMY22_g18480 [Coprinellus aureogranulatus]